MKTEFYVQFTPFFGPSGNLTRLSPSRVFSSRPSALTGFTIKVQVDIPEGLVIPTATLAMTESVEDAIKGLRGVVGALEQEDE